MPTAIQISRDEAMLLGNAERWRDAMATMGRTAVEAELRSRPGRPTDRVIDIGYAPPYPTREFCQQWCTEQDNRLFRFSPRVGIALTLFVVLLVCVLEAFNGLGGAPVRPGSGAGQMATAGRAAPRALQMMPQGIQNVPPYQPSTSSQSMQSSSMQLPTLPTLPSLLSVPTMQQNTRTGGSTSP
jgi:hypothetical protein